MNSSAVKGNWQVEGLSGRKSYSHSLSDAIALPRLVHVKSNIYAAVFSVMKLLPAKFIIENAIAEGELDSRMTVIETSSGNFALGLGIICCEHGLPFIIVTDPAIDDNLKQRLEYLGGEVITVDKPAVQGGYQQARLTELQNRMRRNPLSFWSRQYSNTGNPDAYRSFADQLMDAFGSELVVVGAVGSGGSTCGTIRRIRESTPEARLVGVDTFNSILFGLEDGKRLLRGLGNSILPRNLDHTCFDEIHWVSAAEAFLATRELFKKTAIFAGPTTGAAYMVAREISRNHKKNAIVFTAPDDGVRYISTVYNPVWLKDNDVYCERLPAISRRVQTPLDACQSWCSIDWKRRPLANTFTPMK